MAKAARSNQRSRKPAATPAPATAPRRRLTAWPALIAGLVILGLGAALWQYFAAVTFDDRLLRKLPRDSALAGSARLSAFELDTLKQLTTAISYGNPAVLDGLKTGADQAKLREAFEDQFAFASTARGQLFIFTVRQETGVSALRDGLRAQIEQPQTVRAGELTVLQGIFKGTTTPVAVSRSGNEVYVASNAGLIEAASKESAGFTQVPKFSEVSGKLPSGRHGYLFYNPEVVRSPLGLNVGLLGASLLNRSDTIDISVAGVEPLPVSATLDRTSGQLLPAADLAVASVAGHGPHDLLRLLEEQRQEGDPPRAILLQNGLASASRTLGTDVVDTYFSAVGDYTYARFQGADAKPAWMGALEFESAQTAQQKVDDLVNRMRASVTFPVRREVVNVLPDGTQSREVTGEGREPATFVPFTAAGRTGQAVTVPGSLGTVHYVLEGQYLVVASSPEGIERMVKSLSNQGSDFQPSGALALRVKLSDRGQLLTGRDSLYDWLLSARPSGGEFKLDKASGELTGTVNFASR